MKKYLILLLIFLGGCGSSNESSPSKNPLNIPLNEIVWEGYANQREDLYDTYHKVKNCLKNSGLEIQIDSYPYVLIVIDEIPTETGKASGRAFLEEKIIYVWGTVLNNYAVFAHELIHILMQWENSRHEEPEFQTCGQIILINIED